MRAKDSNLVTDTARVRQVSLKNWGDPPKVDSAHQMKVRVAVDCGWGRLVFGQTFDDPEVLAETLNQEAPGKRDVAFYAREPHLILAHSPQTLFLDPSHVMRLEFAHVPQPIDLPSGFRVRRVSPADEVEINRLYHAWSMVPIDGDCLAGSGLDPAVKVLVAEDERHPGNVVGVVMGIDHRDAINDPDNGSSLWALAVDPHAGRPGAGEAMVATLANAFRAAGRKFMDLSVMHDNTAALALYNKLGFEYIPAYSVKKKNPINEKLFIGPAEAVDLNPYARIIADEARRRGITVEVEDTKAGLLRLSHGGRSIACRESLCDLTTAVAMSRCDDKALTHRLLSCAKLLVPAQVTVETREVVGPFLAEHRRVVVKPARGEQGQGVAVDLGTPKEIFAAIDRARDFSDKVIMEEYVSGHDLRIIVIDGAVAAAAIRRPPDIRGDGSHSIRELIEKLSRRRAKATSGESRIPIDDETRRSVAGAGYGLDDLLPAGETLTVRKTANLHTGGTIHDVTPDLHPDLAKAARKAARVLDIPVVGLDFVIHDSAAPDYAIIEANERPGLANHEPQPTAERFIDLLFPQTITDGAALTDLDEE